MRVSYFIKLIIVFGFLLLLGMPVLAGLTPEEAEQYLPDKVGSAQAQKWFAPPMPAMPGGPQRDNWVAGARRSYTLPNGQTVEVALEKMQTDSAAYALLTANADWSRKALASQLN